VFVAAATTSPLIETVTGVPTGTINCEPIPENVRAVAVLAVLFEPI